MVIPLPSPTTTAGAISRALQKEIGTVVVENRPGAGSTMATGQLARGGRGSDHTILMASPGHTIGPVIYKNLPYDPVKDFKFIRNVIEIPNVMVVPANSPYNSVEEFIKAAKDKEMTFSSSGIGSSIHMSGELFKTMTGTNMTHVPFRGSDEAVQTLQGALDKVMEDQTFQDFISQIGGEAATQEGDQFRGYVATDVERWQDVVGQAELQ